MRSWRLTNQPTHLTPGDLPRPTPGAGEILIRVHAAGVTPTELAWYPTTHTKAGGPRTDAVPGHEFSGTIESVGPSTADSSIGQEVYGMNDWFAEGATADFCITRPEWVAPKPARLSHAEAASVPIGALTAWQGLFDRAQLQPGERVLIHGGSGAVGVYAIQLARRHGARVITTASVKNAEFLRGLGAEQVIDYRTEPFDKIVKQVDVVFDAVGGETLERSWNLLGANGRLVTIASNSEGTQDERTKKAFFIVEPKRAQLITIGSLLEAASLIPVVDVVVPFSQAGAAYSGEIQNRPGRGKLVVSIPD